MIAKDIWQADILDALADGVVVRDAAGAVVTTNAAARRMLGVAGDQGMNVDQSWSARDVIHEDGSPFPRDEYPDEAVLRTGQPRAGIVMGLLNTDGTRTWISADSSPIWKDGGPAGVVTILHDITGRTRDARAPENRERVYRLLAENVTDLLWILDVDSRRFRYVTPSVERLLGYTANDAVEHGWIDAVFASESSKIAVQRLLEKAPEFKRQGHVEVGDTIELTHRNGSTIWMEFNARYVLDDETGHVQIYGVSRDVTERRRAEAERQRHAQELAQAQKMESIGRLAGGIAHDFNNILADIVVQLGLAEARYPEIQGILQDLRTDADLGARLVRQLLMFGRRSPMQVRAIDLNEAAARLLNMIERLLGANIAVRFEPAPAAAGIEADPGMLEQVIMNLAINARDAMPHGGTLAIAVSSSDGLVCLSVSDTGTGMDDATLARAFEPFSNHTDKGTGLGLAMVHGIVTQHGGRVDARSVLGQGSTFRVFFPAAALPAAPARPPAHDASHRGTETILLVDDFARLREKMAESLRHLGYEVLQAGTGEEALRLWGAHRSRIGLLFTDISLPGGMNGFEIADALCASAPSLRVIFSSGYGDEMMDERRQADGMVFLPKPCDLGVMARTIRECFDKV